MTGLPTTPLQLICAAFFNSAHTQTLRATHIFQLLRKRHGKLIIAHLRKMRRDASKIRLPREDRPVVAPFRTRKNNPADTMRPGYCMWHGCRRELHLSIRFSRTRASPQLQTQHHHAHLRPRRRTARGTVPGEKKAHSPEANPHHAAPGVPGHRRQPLL